jgi:hypothetical protein
VSPVRYELVSYIPEDDILCLQPGTLTTRPQRRSYLRVSEQKRSNTADLHGPTAIFCLGSVSPPSLRREWAGRESIRGLGYVNRRD